MLLNMHAYIYSYKYIFNLHATTSHNYITPLINSLNLIRLAVSQVYWIITLLANLSKILISPYLS